MKGGRNFQSTRLAAAALVGLCIVSAGAYADHGQSYPFTWSTVVNNGDDMPTATCNPAAPLAPLCRKFNSYNQPSVNAARLVVFRARSRGGGQAQPIHGVYTRDMADAGPVVKILDRDTPVPPPNNRGTVFIEPPSFPRIDIDSNTVATRGNHQPVWKVLDAAGEIVEQTGTSGIYTNPFGDLITGAGKLGAVSAFSFFEVPERPGTFFDVFPGAPAVTDGDTIVFKGNYTVGLVAKTGVYYRELVNSPIPIPDGTLLAPAGGTNPVILIANSDTFIPGTTRVFGSTAPPSAANHMAVFAGFDNEDNPTLGGIYLAPLTGPLPRLKTLVSIGDRVPGEKREARFNRLGEGVSFDGRFVAFWGAWGAATKTLILQCPIEGNADRVLFCRQQYPDGFTVRVPVNQGIFVYDIRTRQIRVIAKSPADFGDFVFWNFSGLVPGASEGDEDGEPARWRSSAFVAVSGAVEGRGIGATFHAAFKARTGNVRAGAYVNPVDGIYLRKGPGQSQILTVAKTGMDGTLIDPAAVDTETGAALPVTEVGIERDGFRGNSLVINASMGSEVTGWAGIYLSKVRERD